MRNDPTWGRRYYQFDTTADPPTLRNIGDNLLIATGKLIGGYAVFDFPGNISVANSDVTVAGAHPLVLLTQSDFTLKEGTSFIVRAGGADHTGPGGGQLSGTAGDPSAQYGGGSFGGLGGGPVSGTYGDDFVGRLQGGSGGSDYGNGGGGIYIGAVGTIALSNASLAADGTSIVTSTSRASYAGGGGSGGGIALFSNGGITVSSATVSAAGGSGGDGYIGKTGGGDIIGPRGGRLGIGYGGGGGRVLVGYRQGTPAPDLGFINVSGSSVPAGRGGFPGGTSSVSFAGF